MDFTLKYKRDIEADNDSGRATLILYGETNIHQSSFTPASLLGGYSNGPRGDVWRLTPYIGLEKYQGTLAVIDGVISATEKIDPSYFLFRYYAEVWPFRFENGHGIQFVTTVAFRNLIADEGVENPHFSSAAINYTFDKEGNIAIGLSYTSGDNPDNSFLDEEKTTLSLKVMY